MHAGTGNDIKSIPIGSYESYVNRELSWLSFARRVLALAEDPKSPLLERVKFAGIMGMLYDEFSMKRMGGLRRKIEKRNELKALNAELDEWDDLFDEDDL